VYLRELRRVDEAHAGRDLQRTGATNDNESCGPDVSSQLSESLGECARVSAGLAARTDGRHDHVVLGGQGRGDARVGDVRGSGSDVRPYLCSAGAVDSRDLVPACGRLVDDSGAHHSGGPYYCDLHLISLAKMRHRELAGDRVEQLRFGTVTGGN
jgi:hypothetical protein